MNEQAQKLSSLLDDYRHTDQDRSILNDVLGDVNQQYTLRRYQLISDTMCNELPGTIKLDFAAGVMAQIRQEAEIHVSKASANRSEKPHSALWSLLFKPAAGLAIAATVAFVAVSSLQPQSLLTDSNDTLASVNSSNAKVEHLVGLPVISNVLKVSSNGQVAQSQDGMNWKIKRNEPEIQSKLNSYLINHNEYATSMQGIIPQARVVGFDAQK